MVIRLPLSTGAAFAHDAGQAPVQIQSALLRRHHAPPLHTTEGTP
jgi:two-component system, OmpR family, sensor histidine kinase KdpD